MTTIAQVTDATLGTGAVSSPLWVSYISTSLNWYVMAAGAILLTLRIIHIIYDIRKDRKDDPS